jgi:2-polyprenyl-3-methyl-5-hydroxy-6-metoxy-1,4-benzoquinol methylase
MIEISNHEFRRIEQSRHSGRWFSKSHDGLYFLKVQDLSVPIRQKHNLKDVDIFMRKLLKENSQVTPKVIDSGYFKEEFTSRHSSPFNSENLFYQITEYVPPIKKISSADLYLSLLEIASLSIFPNDIKPNNLGWKNNRIYFLDYDQSIILDYNFENLDARSIINHLNALQVESLGFEFLNLSTKSKKCFLANTGKLDLTFSSRFKRQKSTRNKINNYHSINTTKLFAPGSRDIEIRKGVLKDYKFKTGSLILDIGANLGLLSRFFEAKGGQVYATEIDTCTRSLGQTISIIEGSCVEYLDGTDSSSPSHFDVILLFSVLHHMENFWEVAKSLDDISDKILIETRLRESGKVIKNRFRWTKSGSWNFSSVTELEFHLQSLFPKKQAIELIGKSDKSRLIFELSKF